MGRERAGAALAAMFAAAGVTLITGSMPARAADLPAKAAVAAVPAPLWQGLHVGGLVGGVVSDASVTPHIAGSFRNSPLAPVYQAEYGIPLGGSSTGLTAGVTLGYDWQFPAGGAASVVLGFETDLSYAGLDKQGTVATPSLIVAGAYIPKTYSFDGDWFGTLRARVGVAFDRVLLYATGGLAYGNGGSQVLIVNPDFATQTVTRAWLASDATEMRVGWALGGGGEVKLDTHWSVKAEYLYVDLGGDTYAFTRVVFPTTGFMLGAESDYAFSVVRAGVNYRF